MLLKMDFFGRIMYMREYNLNCNFLINLVFQWVIWNLFFIFCLNRRSFQAWIVLAWRVSNGCPKGNTVVSREPLLICILKMILFQQLVPNNLLRLFFIQKINLISLFQKTSLDYRHTYNKMVALCIVPGCELDFYF